MSTLQGGTVGALEPCRWCGDLTDLRLAPEGSRVGPVPLHMLCGAAFIKAYGRWRFGLAKPEDTRRIVAVLGGPS